MYSLTVTNSSGAPIEAGDGKTIKPGGRWTAKELGNTFLHSEELGSMSFRDLGERHIGGDTGETWGVLITYQGNHMVGRYEGGGGQLKVKFNEDLQAVVDGMSLRRVRLDPLMSKEEEAAAVRAARAAARAEANAAAAKPAAKRKPAARKAAPKRKAAAKKK
jgi:hypothetical protein